MIFKSYDRFKQTFNELFKKYHPDNQETGDKELFMKYKNAYDLAMADPKMKQLTYNTEVDVTTTQAYKGCTITTPKFTIKIPPKFYNKRDYITMVGNDGIRYKIYVHIVPEKDEEVHYKSPFMELMITKYLYLNIFEIIFGCEKSFTACGETHKLKFKPYAIFQTPTIILNDMGYASRQKNKRNPLTLKLMFDNIILTKEEKAILDEMRKKYAKIG